MLVMSQTLIDWVCGFIDEIHFVINIYFKHSFYTVSYSLTDGPKLKNDDAAAEKTYCPNGTKHVHLET